MAKAPPASEPAFDLRKLAGEFDPNKLMGQLQTMLTQYKLPGVDIDKLIAAQQKEHRSGCRGQPRGRRRHAGARQAPDGSAPGDPSAAVSSLSKAGSPAELAAKEAELGKGAFEKSVATMREMAEILVKSSQEAADKINDRIAALGPHGPGGDRDA